MPGLLGRDIGGAQGYFRAMKLFSYDRYTSLTFFKTHRIYNIKNPM